MSVWDDHTDQQAVAIMSYAARRTLSARQSPAAIVRPGSPGATVFLGLSLIVGASGSSAQIVTDGTMGPATALSGPNVVIPNTLGSQVGGNLFHSFDDFRINVGESATFTSDFAGVTNNVISRVTGQNPTVINGLLRNSIPGADFWFINPRGVAFGAGASLDMTASFYASTANSIELGDCAATPAACSFSATTPAVSALSAAAPAAFGFIEGVAGQISASSQPGERAELPVPQGKSLFLAGSLGTVESDGALGGGLANTRLAAPEGRVDLVSVGTVAPGQTGFVRVPGSPNEAPVVEGFAQLAPGVLSNSDVHVNGVNGGRVYLRGSRIVMDSSMINASGAAEGDAGRIDVEATEFRMVTTSPTDSAGSEVFVNTDAIGSSGAAGEAVVRARTIEIRDGGRIEAVTRDGPGGLIALYGDSIVVNEGEIQAGTKGKDQGGTIAIGGHDSTGDHLRPAVSLTVTGNDGDLSNDGPDAPRGRGTIRVDSDFFGERGLPGEIRVAAESVRLGGGGTLFATNRDGVGLPGARGLIDVQVQDLYLEGGIAAQTFGSGPGSDLRIRGIDQAAVPANSITMPGLDETGFYSYIQAGSSSNDPLLGNRGGGRPGNILVAATSIEMGSDAQITNGINAFGLESSSGFRIDVDAGTLLMRDGAFISSNTGGGASAGIVAIEADMLTLRGSGTRIEATSRGQGAAGDITLRSFDTVIDGGLVSTTVFGSGAGGSIVLETDRLELLNGGSIDTSSRPELLSLLSVGSFDDLSFDTNRSVDLQYDSATGLGPLDPGEVQAIAFGAGQIPQPSQFIAAFDMLPETNPDPLDLIARSGFETVDDGSPLPGSGVGPLVRGAVDAGQPVELKVTGNPDFGGYPFFEFAGQHAQSGNYRVEIQLRPITALPAAGDGGTITVRGRSGPAADNILISGTGSGLFSISAGDPATSGAVALAGAGDAGSINAMASNVVLQDGGQISVQSVGDGRAGAVDVTATEMILRDARISAEAPGALAGNVVLDVQGYLRLTRSTISGESAAADVAGGNFFIANVPSDRSILDQPDAGYLDDIMPMQALVLNEGSLITASSAAAGSGNIVIAAEARAISSDSRVTATGYIVSIGAVLADVTQIDQPELVDASDELATRCTPQQIENRSSLLVRDSRPGAARSPYLRMNPSTGTAATSSVHCRPAATSF